MSTTVEVGVVPWAVAVFVNVPPVEDAVIGPTTHIVTFPGDSGSVKAHDAVETFASVTLIDERTIPPVFAIVNRYQTFDPAATVTAEDQGPSAAALISLRRLNPAAAPRYHASAGLEGTGAPRYEPLPVAVFGCDPETAARDVGAPPTQDAESPGARDAGHEQPAGSTPVPASVGSEAERLVSATSPEL